MRQVARSINTDTGTARRTVAVAAGAAALVLAWGSAAWACSPAAAMSRMYLGAGVEDSKVIVTGSNFTANVQILWASDTSTLATATPLATATGPSFSVRITIPHAPPGLYYVVAVGRDNTGVQGRAASTFDLLPSAAEAPPNTEATPEPVPEPGAPPATAPVPAVKDQTPGSGAPTSGGGSTAPAPPPALAAPRTSSGTAGAVVTAPRGAAPAPVTVPGVTGRPTAGAPLATGATDAAEPALVSPPPAPNPWAFDPIGPGSSGLLSPAGDSAPRHGRSDALGLGLLIAGGGAAVAAAVVLATSRSRRLRRALVRRR